MIRRIAIVLLAIFCPGPTLASGQAGLSQEEAQLINRVNEERENVGLPRLSSNKQLAEAARNHTQLLKEHGQLSHQFPGELSLLDRLQTAGLWFDASAENVAYAPSVEDAHQDLMHSPPHRANILNPHYNAIGVSLMQRGGSVYVTEDFAHTLPNYTEEQFQGAFIAAFNKARSARGRGAIAAQSDSRLHDAACAGGANVRELVKRMNGASDWVVLTTAEPEPLPAEMLKAAADSTFRKMSVGVCRLPRKEHGFEGFRVISVFFVVN